jgi:hypothetical protein
VDVVVEDRVRRTAIADQAYTIGAYVAIFAEGILTALRTTPEIRLSRSS